MLKPGDIRSARRIWRLATWFGILPYRWNTKTSSHLEISPRRARYLVSVAELILYCSYECFLMGRLFHAKFFDSSATTPEVITLQYTAIASLLILVCDWMIVRNYGKHPGWISRFMEYCEETDSTMGHQEVLSCTPQIRILVTVGSLTVVVNVLGNLKRPFAREFLSSLVFDPATGSTLRVRLMQLLHFWIFCYQWISIWTCWVQMFLYLQSVATTHRLLKIHKVAQNSCSTVGGRISASNMMFKASGGPRYWIHGGRYATLSELMKRAVRLEILQLEFNDMWQFWIWGQQVSSICISVLSLYSTIKVGGMQILKLIPVFILVISLILFSWNKMADIYESSYDTQESWKVARGDKLFRIFHRRMKPCRVHIGGTFYADRLLVLTILEVIIVNTVNLLVTT